MSLPVDGCKQTVFGRTCDPRSIKPGPLRGTRGECALTEQTQIEIWAGYRPELELVLSPQLSVFSLKPDPRGIPRRWFSDKPG